MAGRGEDVQDPATIKPTDAFKLMIDYYRLRSDGVPDFGVP